MKKVLVSGHYLGIGDFIKVRYATSGCPEYSFEGFVTKLMEPNQVRIDSCWSITDHDIITEHIPCEPSRGE